MNIVIFQKAMWDVNDKGHHVDTERAVVRIHDVAAGGARARPQARGAEAGAMTLLGARAPRLTRARVRGARARARTVRGRAPH